MTKEMKNDFRKVIQKQWSDILSASTLEEYGEATYQYFKPESVSMRVRRSVEDVESLILDKLKREPDSNTIKINNLIQYTMFGEETFAKARLETEIKDYLSDSEMIEDVEVKFKKDKDEVVITWKNK